MKKYLLIPFLAVMAFTACKKKENSVSTLVTYSTPTISFSGSTYYSIPVGGVLPTIAASSYDSFYKEKYPVVIDQSTLDNTTPGLYVVSITSKNRYGMVGTSGIYVAVTNISPLIHLEGTYQRLSNLIQVNVARRANGLYEIDNVAGVNPATAPGSVVPAIFVQIDDSTMSFPTQSSTVGNIYGITPSISMAVGDTTFQYKMGGADAFNHTNFRVFQKL